MDFVSSFDLHINVSFVNFCCLNGSFLFLGWLRLASFLLLSLTCCGNLSSIVWLLLPWNRLLGELVFFAAIDEGLDQIVDLDDCLSVDQFVEPALVLQDSCLQEHILLLFSLATIGSFCWRSVLVNFFHLLISVLGFGAIIGWLLRLFDLLDFTKELIDFAFDNLLVFEQEDVDWDGLSGVMRIFGHAAVSLWVNLGHFGHDTN